MRMIADQLPPELASQLHPDRRRNEAEYWAARDGLLEQFSGQWVGFASGKVIASGKSPVAVFHKAEQSGLHPFVICVGREEEPIRIRLRGIPKTRFDRMNKIDRIGRMSYPVNPVHPV